MVDTARLQHVMQFVEDNPKRHIQDEWICGTGACFAGWACLLYGWKWFRGKEWDSADRVYQGRKPKVMDLDRTRHIQDVAVEILSLDYDDAVILFWGNNSADMLRQMVDDLEEGRKLAWSWAPVVDAHHITTMERLVPKVLETSK